MCFNHHVKCLNSVTPTFTALPICENATAQFYHQIQLISELDAINCKQYSIWNVYFYSNEINVLQPFSLEVIGRSRDSDICEIPPVCYSSVAPILPSTSTNGISGTWRSVGY
jgi:hypothetical protein